MNRINFFAKVAAIFVVATFAFVSCGEDEPTPLPQAVKVTSINFAKTAMSIDAGYSDTVKIASILPTSATNQSLTWSSEPTGWVNENGVVSVPQAAIKGETATVTATTNDGSKVMAVCTITVGIRLFTVGVATTEGGTAKADVTEAPEGTTVTLTATPNDEFLFVRWVAESGKITFAADSAANPATFTLPASNVSVKAEFIQVFNIDVTATEGGTVTVDTTKAIKGTTITLNATANEGYKFVEWMVESGGITLDPAPSVTFVMPAVDVSVKAVFAELQVYSIIVTATQGGTASSNVTEILEGSTVELTYTVEEGYTLRRWIVESGGIAVAGVLKPVKFTMPAAHVSIKAEFGTIKPWTWDSTTNPYGTGGYLGTLDPSGFWTSAEIGNIERNVYADQEMVFGDMSSGSGNFVKRKMDGTVLEEGTWSIDTSKAKLMGDGNIWSIGEITFTGASIINPYSFWGGGEPYYTFDIIKLTGTQMILATPNKPGIGAWDEAYFWCFELMEE